MRDRKREMQYENRGGSRRLLGSNKRKKHGSRRVKK
jgi:hypothetical protein